MPVKTAGVFSNALQAAAAVTPTWSLSLNFGRSDWRVIGAVQREAAAE